MTKNKLQIVELLNNLNIAFEVIEHKAVFTMDEIIELNLPKSDFIAKNLFVRDDKKRNYYLISMQGDKKVDLKMLRKKINSRPLSFASENDLNTILGLEKGSVTPFGILNDQECKVKVLIDMAFSNSLIGVHPNENTATIWLKTEDLLSIIKQHGNTINLVKL